MLPPATSPTFFYSSTPRSFLIHACSSSHTPHWTITSAAAWTLLPGSPHTSLTSCLSIFAQGSPSNCNYPPPSPVALPVPPTWLYFFSLSKIACITFQHIIKCTYYSFYYYYISPSARTKAPQVEEILCFGNWCSSDIQNSVWHIVVAE